VDAGNTLVYSLSGPDAGRLNINRSTGQVTLKASADYETKSQYSFNVIVSDGTGYSDPFSALNASLWQSSNWANGGVFRNSWSPAQVQSVGGDLVITLAGNVSGEYSTLETSHYGYYETRLQASGEPGTVNGFFTYTGPGDGTQHHEIDVEILGDDPRQVQVNYWTNGVEHPTTINLGFDASLAKHTYAFDWRADCIIWYVDGVEIHRENGSNGPLTSLPGKVMVNLWATQNSNGWSSDGYDGTSTSLLVDYVTYDSRATQHVTVSVDDRNDAPTGSVSITGSPVRGQILRVSNTLADDDGMGAVAYQWFANGVAIAGATGSTLTLGSAPVGKTLSVKASYTDAGGHAETKSSASTHAVLNGLVTGTTGNDTLMGSYGANTLKGGVGNDIYFVNHASDVVSEGSNAGTDFVYSYLSAYTLASNVEAGCIMSTGAANLTGNGGSNLLYAGSGVNKIDGGAGVDTVSYAYAKTSGTSGVKLNLSILNASAEAVASGISGADRIKNIENITGSNYADGLAGNSLANVLNGGAGNDTLSGGLGADRLSGGSGIDRFLFNTTLGRSNIDTISDFAHGGDKIVLDDDIFKALGVTGTTTGAALKSGSFYAAAGASAAHLASDRIVYDTTSGRLYYDADGLGGTAAVQIALIGTGTHAALSAGDFLVVA